MFTKCVLRYFVARLTGCPQSEAWGLTNTNTNTDYNTNIDTNTSTNTNTILYYTISYYTILYYYILYYIILYYAILYYTTLHYTILYYTIPPGLPRTEQPTGSPYSVWYHASLKMDNYTL